MEARLRDPRAMEIPDEQLRREMLARAVDDFLLAGWAEKQVEEPPEEAVEVQVQEAIARLERAARGRGELNDLLRKSGIDAQEFRMWIKEKARRSMQISDALAAFADLGGRNPVDTSPEKADRVRLAHIFIQSGAASPARKEALEEALTIRKDLEKGIPFAKAASLYSDDRYTAERGGSLGWFTREEAAPAIWQAATALFPGEVSSPVETENGFHLVRLIDYETPQQREYLRLMQEEEWRRLAQLREQIGIRLAPGYELQPIPEEFQKPENEEISDGPSDPDGI
jgi:parvulin-like peptidyl-prolyl isomerase